MAIFGIEGGIGTGKTLTGVWFTINDLYANRNIYSNVYLKNIKKGFRENITYLDKEFVAGLFQKIKDKEIDMKNSTVFIQEAHNYLDSRNAMSKKNKVLSYWILQSRHTGEGACDIIYDTQELGQVDIRLRRNTDHIIRPHIRRWEKTGKTKKPAIIDYQMLSKIGHSWKILNGQIDVSETREMYDTHEIVDF